LKALLFIHLPSGKKGVGLPLSTSPPGSGLDMLPTLDTNSMLTTAGSTQSSRHTIWYGSGYDPCLTGAAWSGGPGSSLSPHEWHPALIWSQKMLSLRTSVLCRVDSGKGAVQPSHSTWGLNTLYTTTLSVQSLGCGQPRKIEPQASQEWVLGV
jgi:hypothetical protein